MSEAGDAFKLPPLADGGTKQLGAIWLLFGSKAGDNAQVEALAAALTEQPGWHYKVKQLQHHPAELLLHLASRPTLLGISRNSRRQLAPPWPALVITAGRRNELVALWIKARCPATRVVHVGRPWCRPERFDLVITTPQYCLERFGNVLTVALPLNPVDAGRIDEAREGWRERLAGLPSPRTVLLVGGASGAYLFHPEQAAALAARVRPLLERSGGSLLVSTSARTPRRFAAALFAALPRPDFAYRYGDSGENPYFGLLAWGDRFVVTEDSVSMTAEAMATGKPVLLAPIGSEPAGSMGPWWLAARKLAWKPLTHRLAQRLAPRRYHRDVRRLYAQLVRAGQLSWLDDGAPAWAPGDIDAAARDRQRARRDDLQASVSRVLSLFGA